MALKKSTDKTILHQDSEGHNKQSFKNETDKEDKSNYVFMAKSQEEHLYQNRKEHSYSELHDCQKHHDFGKKDNGKKLVTVKNSTETLESSTEDEHKEQNPESVYEVVCIDSTLAKSVDKTIHENPKPQNSDCSYGKKEPKCHKNNAVTTQFCNTTQQDLDETTLSTNYPTIPQKGNKCTQAVETKDFPVSNYCQSSVKAGCTFGNCSRS